MADIYALVGSQATAAEFHARPVPVPARREIWQHELTAPALVLGSTQRNEVVDVDACRSAGVDVVRRRSGGGAVLLIPGEVHWIDVIVPRDSPGWATDVHAPMRWLGDHLVHALEPLVAPRRVVSHHGAMVTTPWSTTICFDGVGVGEVLLDGAKLVGISQRRTRDTARLQCCWYSSYDPDALVSLLAASHRPRPELLAPVAVVPDAVASALPQLLLRRLNA